MTLAKTEFMRREITLRIRFLIFILLVLVIFFAVISAVRSSQLKRLKAESTQVHEDIKVAQAKIEEMQNRLAFTETDDYIAQEARQRFGYMEDGEIRFVLEDSAAANAPKPLIVIAPTPEPSPSPTPTPEPVQVIGP